MDQTDGHHTAPDSDDWQEALLLRISAELRDINELLDIFQHDLSDFLEQIRMSPERMKRLQGLDEATQILGDLSRVLRVLAEHGHAPREVCQAALCEQVIMSGLRLRLCGKNHSCGPTEENQRGEVRLF